MKKMSRLPHEEKNVGGRSAAADSCRPIRRRGPCHPRGAGSLGTSSRHGRRLPHAVRRRRADGRRRRGSLDVGCAGSARHAAAWHRRRLPPAVRRQAVALSPTEALRGSARSSSIPAPIAIHRIPSRILAAPRPGRPAASRTPRPRTGRSFHSDAPDCVGGERSYGRFAVAARIVLTSNGGRTGGRHGSVRRAWRWGRAAKLLPVATIRPPSRQATSTSRPKARTRPARVRVVEPRLGIAQIVGRDRHDGGGEERRIAGDGHVVRRADQEAVGEVRAIGELVERGVEGLAPRREAEVHDRRPALDRPVEAAGEGQALAAVVGPEHADADQLRLRGQGMDDAGAGGPVAHRVDRLVGNHLGDLAVDLRQTLSTSAPSIAGCVPSTPESMTATVTPARVARAERPRSLDRPRRGSDRSSPDRWPAANASLQAGSAPPTDPGPARQADGPAAALCVAEEHREQLADEIQLTRIGRPKARDLIGERPQRIGVRVVEAGHGIGNDRLDVVRVAARARRQQPRGVRRATPPRRSIRLLRIATVTLSGARTSSTSAGQKPPSPRLSRTSRTPGTPSSSARGTAIGSAARSPFARRRSDRSGHRRRRR